MRVLMLNQVFYPDVAATAQHGHDLARSLVANGHEVTAIASRSLYGTKGAALPKRETVDGIEIRRVGKSFFGKSSIIGRVADFLYFYVAATVRAITLPRHDVVICFTTPPFIGFSGLILRLLKGTRFVYWVMDLYPDVLVVCGVAKERSFGTRFLEGLNRWCLNRADVDVVLGRCMRDRVLAKGIDPAKVRMIGVWSDQEEVSPIEPEQNRYRIEWGIGDRMLVMYSGNFGLGHDVETFLQAAVKLKDDDRIRFAFVGGGKRKEQVEQFVHDNGLEGTCILEPFQPRERLDELLSAGDVHLASMLEGTEGIMVPSKLFGILAVGRPALFIGSERSEIARVIAENDCGRTIREGDCEELVRAILNYTVDPTERRAAGERARRALIEEHSAKIRCRAWLELLEEITAR
ncbi:MAG: glycosyltransferase family 4 protein [Planctomycetota bacterium]|nr:glycosyltransferase family 4 protein [Planctomycetota bacterium]